MKSRSSSLGFPPCEVCDKVDGYHSQVRETAAIVKPRNKAKACPTNEFKSLFNDPCSCGICMGKYGAKPDPGGCQICAPHPCIKQKAAKEKSDECDICAPHPCLKKKFDAGKAAISKLPADCNVCHGPCKVKKDDENDAECSVCHGPCKMKKDFEDSLNKDSKKGSACDVCHGPCVMKDAAKALGPDCKYCKGPCVKNKEKTPECKTCNGPCKMKKDSSKMSDCNICKGPCAMKGKDKDKGVVNVPITVESDCHVCAPHPCSLKSQQKKTQRSRSVSFERKCCKSVTRFDNIPDRL
jgi:hypothetical protein